MPEPTQGRLFDPNPSRDVAYKEPKRPTGKKSGPRAWYMNWGGLFPHPTLDPEGMAVLPEHRRREILYVTQAFADDPTLQATEYHDPSTGKPYPGQNVFKAPEGLYYDPPVIPHSIRYNIPDGIPLRIVRHYGSFSLRFEIEDLTPEERRELRYLFLDLAS